MDKVPMPNSLEEIDAIWMNQALKANAVIKNSTVTACNAEAFGEGVGLMGVLARAVLEYDRPEEGAPATLIIKLPTAAPENLMVALTFKFYQREMDFYRNVADIACLRTPILYYADMSEDGQKFVMLMEDLGQTLDQVSGADPDHSYKALMELAKFHAQQAPKVQGNEYSWLLDSMEPDYVALNASLYQQAVEPALKNFSEHFNPETQKLARRMAENITPLMTTQIKEGLTLIHGDYRLDNLFVGKLPKRANCPEEGLAVVDWQICCKAECAFDLAYHLCSIDIDARRQIEETVRVDYHRALVENGMQDYPFDTFMIQYRRMVTYCLMYSITVAGHHDLANERGVALARTSLDRTLASVQDNNSAEVLPS